MLTRHFQYLLPPSAIAQVPVEPRHAARLLDADRLTDHQFLDLPALLLPDDLVVVNTSRVRPSRLIGRKHPSGGEVEALLLEEASEGVWEAMVRPARRLRRGQALRFGPIKALVLRDPEDGRAVLRMETDGRPLAEALESLGQIPVPPYVRRPLADPERYQTMFAKLPGSAAAPTAGLHFTPVLTEALAACGVELAGIDLGVGLDTFRPITSETVAGHRLHRERFVVPPATAEAVHAARRRGGRVVAVGTTVTRALESAADGDGTVRAVEGETGLFIRPGHRFRVVDVLVTNFHAPASTLLVMLAAFMEGRRWRPAYAHALARGYRFLSFGDAMLARRGGPPR